MYKILFCDIDGTLTKTASKISRLNLIAIKKYLLNGGEFVLCSGRSYNACKSIIKKIEVFTGYKLHFLICLAGAMVVDLEKNEFVFTKKIPNMVAKTLYGYARKNRF
jgi:HAD superfamily hydrolase (TIGR01484 family)